jgi:hypothetical protein
LMSRTMEPWEIMYVWIDDDNLILSCCKRGAELSCVVRVLTREAVLRHAQKNTGEDGSPDQNSECWHAIRRDAVNRKDSPLLGRVR